MLSFACMPEHENYLQLSEEEMAEAQQRSAVTPRVVHEAVREEGEDELRRSSSALAWSGLAAGMSMALSLMLEGALRARLPASPWSMLISKFGYSAGFVAVILGRQQLFTENTITPILPFLHKPTASVGFHVARLWAVVLAANLAGALAVAFVLARTGMFSPEIRQAFAAIGGESLENTPGLALLRGIFAGWLIALLVWIMPFADHARFFVIIAVTWTISVCGFTHVVAGSVDVFFMAASGLASWPRAALYVFPTLLGNVLGGLALATAINHAQVVS